MNAFEKRHPTHPATRERIEKVRLKLGQRLFRKAQKIRASQISQRSVLAETKGLKRKGLSRREIADLCSTADHLILERRRQKLTAISRERHVVTAKRRPAHRRIVLPNYEMVGSTPAKRLFLERERRIAATFRANLRYSSHHHNVRVVLVEDPRLVGFQLTSGRVYPYRGKYKTYPAISTDWRIAVPIDYLSRVLKRELNQDGLPVLDAQPLESPAEDVELYAATWVEQARGMEVRIEKGFIARTRPPNFSAWIAYHGETVEKAVSGLARKLKARLTMRDPVRARTATLNRYAERYGSVPVTWDDSRAVGNCDYGTRSWCHGVGIDPDQDSVPLARVIEGYQQRPQREAYRVIRLIVSRARTPDINSLDNLTSGNSR